MAQKLYNAIVCCIDETTKQQSFLKFRNINETGRDGFYSFLKRQHPTAQYVNWYQKNYSIGKHTSSGKGIFIERIYIA